MIEMAGKIYEAHSGDANDIGDSSNTSREREVVGGKCYSNILVTRNTLIFCLSC